MFKPVQLSSTEVLSGEAREGAKEQSWEYAACLAQLVAELAMRICPIAAAAS